MRRNIILKTQFRGLGWFVILFFCIIAAPGLQAQEGKNFSHADSLRGTLNPARTAYDVHFYHLNIVIDPAKHTITGANAISFEVIHASDSIQVDLFNNYQVLGVMCDAASLPVTRDGNHLFIHFKKPLKKGERRTIEVHYTGTPPVAKNAPWDGGFVWAKDSLDRDWVGVACEGLGASSWWPCKDHLSDKPDSMEITVGVPDGSFCVSNGQLRSITNLYSGYYEYDWMVTYPVNTYDITVNIGKYQRFRYDYPSKTGNLAVDYFVLDYHEKQAESYFHNQVKPMLDCFEKYFGPYPFTRDGYALVETKYWGMEHQGAIAYGNNFKLNHHGFDFIIIHESAHEWWGNSLSVPDQAEMWLHESFATYAESLFMECNKGRDSAQAYLDEQKRNIANQYPMIGPVGVNFYKRADNDIYYKGAWMLHTLRNVINNDSLWFNIIYGFQEKYKYGIVNTDSFFNYLVSIQLGADTRTSKQKAEDLKKPYSIIGLGFKTLNIRAFLDVYLRQAQLPVLTFVVQQNGSKVKISYSWKNCRNDFDMPVDIDVSGWKYRLYPTKTIREKTLEPQQLPKELKIKKIKASQVKVMTNHFLIDVEP